MTPSLRKLALTTHITASVGWLGALAVFLAHAIANLISQDPQMVRAACLAMGLTAWFVILPLSVTGNGACPGTGYHVGLVSALLGLGKTPAHRFCHNRVAIEAGANQLPSGRSREGDILSRRFCRVADVTFGTRRRRTVGLACDHNVGDIQTVWHDHLRGTQTAQAG